MDWTGTVKRVSRIAEEFHLVSNSSESSTEYRCKFSLKSALQYEIAFNLRPTAHRTDAQQEALTVIRARNLLSESPLDSTAQAHPIFCRS
jgi:hypothetical protein